MTTTATTTSQYRIVNIDNLPTNAVKRIAAEGWQVHSMDCKHFRKSFASETSVVEAADAETAADEWIDEELQEMGYSSSDIEIAGCIKELHSKDTTTLANDKPQCACRCGARVINPKATYLPGHDARHAGNAARAAAEAALSQRYSVSEAYAIHIRPVFATEALREKANRAFLRIVAKANPAATPATTSTTAPIEGTVKVGRWDYPARRAADGMVTRNEKRDASGAWVPFANPERFTAI